MTKLITILILLSWANVNATTYYISVAGSTSNNGTSTSTTWPLSKVNSTTFAAGDNILFKRGDTFYGKITISQSGSAGNPITFGAYGTGANPVITGFTTVSTWTDLGFNVWQSSNVVSTLSSCNVVVIDGINTPMGRTPNSGYWTYPSSTTTSLNSSSLNASTTNWTGAQAVIKTERYTIDKRTITSASGSTINYSATSGFSQHPNWGFFIQNDTRTLDQQNEWYYNGSDKKISVYSTSAPTDVKLATRDTLVYIVNKNYITIDGITFTGSNGQVFYLGNTSNLTIKNCDFDFNYNGIKGYQFGGSSSNVLIDSCTFDQTNNNAIELPSEFAGATITNNSIRNTALFEGMAASGQSRWGINTAGANYLAQYNTVRNVGYVGIGFNGSNVLIKNNIVDSFCIITDDGGGIYTGNVQTGVVISDNIVLNGIGNDEGTNSTNSGRASGIYCDDNSSGMSILNNSVANVIYAGIFLHQAKDITVRGNTTYNCGIGLLVDADDNSKYTTGIEVKRNTFVAKTVGTYFTPQNQLPLWVKSYHDDIHEVGNMDSNYYARPLTDNLTIWWTKYSVNDYKYNLAQWRTFSGYDIHSYSSPQSINNVDQLSFYYNNNNFDSTISLGSNTYVDIKNMSYTGDVVLTPYSSLALISTGALTTPTITWANPSSITYGIALSSTQLNASATVSGTFSYNYSSGTVLNAGSYNLTTVFTPTDGSTYSTATKSVPFTVNKATATLSYSGLTKTYNGSPQSPTVTTSPLGLTGINTTYNGIGAVPTNAGSYAIVTGLTNTNYTATTITNTFTINKATTTISVSNLSQNYTGSPLPVLVTTNPNVSGISVTYNGSATVPTNAGSYTVVASLSNTNYQATPVTTTLVINKATPTVTWNNPSSITYGTALSSTQLNATANVAGSFTYTPSSGTTLNAGTNILSVNLTPTDATNYNSVNNTTVSLTVNKATATISLSNLTQTYDGNPKPVTVTTAPVGLTTITTTYNGSATIPSAVGSYSISSSLSNSNYTANPATGTLVISSSAANIYITNYNNLVYNGIAQTPTVTSAYSYDITYNGSSTAPTNVGSYTAIATINDGVHTGADTVTMTIIKDTPVVTWNNPSSITYGTVLSSTQLNATTSVAGSFSYTPASGTILNSGTYILSTSFTPADASNYNSATSEVSITVNKASATLSLGNLNQVYDGSAKPVTITSSPSGLSGIIVTYNGSATVPTNAGSYPISVTLTNSNYSASPVSGILVISKATPILSWATPQPVQSGTTLTATQLNATSNVAGSFVYSLPLGTIVATGAISITATFTPSSSNYNSGTISILLNVYGNPITNFIIGDYYENK